MTSERDTRFDRFNSDPEAIEWARGPIQNLIDLTRRVAEGCSTPEKRRIWEHRASWIEQRLLGGEGCSIAPFDIRRPKLFKVLIMDEPPEVES
jgi:hypothetical protein